MNYFVTTGNDGGFFEAMAGLSVIVIILIIIAILIGVAIAALVLVANCKLFIKAGEKWWKGLIPLYSNWVETRIVGLNWYWFAILFVLAGLTANSYITTLNSDSLITSASNWVWAFGLFLVHYNYYYNLAKKFGKSVAFGFWTAILPVIFLPILAFGGSKYNKDAKVDENGIFVIKK